MAAIILMGFMGSGKSAVARTVARIVRLPLMDLDQCIEQEIGTSIAKFFASYGEDEFRKVESRVLEGSLRLSSVISLGGGAPTQQKNRELLKKAAREGALVVYLRAESDILAQRIRRQPGKRPLIDGDGVLDMEATVARVQALLAIREPWYREVANFVVDTNHRDIESVAEEVVRGWIEIQHGSSRDMTEKCPATGLKSN